MIFFATNSTSLFLVTYLLLPNHYLEQNQIHNPTSHNKKEPIIKRALNYKIYFKKINADDYVASHSIHQV